MTRKLFTLCFVRKDGQILLGMKKRGFGAGKWNGLGGKVEPGEAIEDATKREVEEESGVVVEELSKHGVITFEFEGNTELMEVHVFSAFTFVGEAVESEEMKPAWFLNKAIPFESMWADDHYWFPFMLENKQFNGYFLFNAAGDSVLKYDLQELTTV